VCGTVSKRQKAAFCADSWGGGSEGGMWLVFKQKYMVYQDKTKDKDKDDKDKVFRFLDVLCFFMTSVDNLTLMTFLKRFSINF
jgi:hypothetical protein